LNIVWQEWQSTKPIRRERPPPTPEELDLSRASGAAYRTRLIESGHIIQQSDDGTTRFRNAAGRPVFTQGRLSAKQLAAPHPDRELEHGSEPPSVKRSTPSVLASASRSHRRS
jgi:hypothetical protein